MGGGRAMAGRDGGVKKVNWTTLHVLLKRVALIENTVQKSLILKMLDYFISICAECLEEICNIATV